MFESNKDAIIKLDMSDLVMSVEMVVGAIIVWLVFGR